MTEWQRTVLILCAPSAVGLLYHICTLLERVNKNLDFIGQQLLKQNRPDLFRADWE